MSPDRIFVAFGREGDIVVSAESCLWVGDSCLWVDSSGTGMQGEIGWRAVVPRATVGLCAAPGTRKSAQCIVILASVLLVAGCCDSKKKLAPKPAERLVSISCYQDATATLTDADADRILAEANAVLEEVNGTGDVSCVVHLKRSGPV